MDPAELVPGKAFPADIFADAAAKAALFAGKPLEVRVVVMMSAGRVPYDSMPYVLEVLRAVVEDERLRCAKEARRVAVEYVRKGQMGLAAVADEVSQKITGKA
jgi:hypothetical protein